jgi:hypothetical protein
MSWENVWPLPRSYVVTDIEAAIAKAIADHAGVRLTPVDPDLAEFADDFAADEVASASIERTISIPRRWLRDAGDRPRGDPQDGDGYVCTFTVDEVDGAWRVWFGSNDAQNRDAYGALAMVVARISVLLGGPEDCEPI